MPNQKVDDDCDISHDSCLIKISDIKQFCFENLRNKSIYFIKLNVICNQTLDPIGGGIISDKIILPAREFGTSVLMNSPLGKNYSFKGRNPYEHPNEILDCNAHIHHHHMVFGICHHGDYL